MSQAVTFSEPVVLRFTVRCSVVTESQPTALVEVNVGDEVEEVKAVPCHVYESQAVTVSTPVVLLLTVRCSVVTESQPAALVEVNVGEEVEAV